MEAQRPAAASTPGRGVQAYRKGDFATARKQFEGIDSDAGWYNLANTLAREGNYDEAIAAYDRALALHPGMADAVANRAVVDAARKRRQSGGGQGQDQQTPPQKQQDRSQGKQNPQGQQPQQGQKDPGQGQPQPGQQGQPGQESDKAQSSPQPGERGRDGQQAPPQVEDAKAQAQADEQQRQRMQQAMQQAREGEADKDGKPVPGSEGRTPRQREEQQR